MPQLERLTIHTSIASKAQAEILTDAALSFITELHNTFESIRQNLLRAREDRQRSFDTGVPLDFPPETEHIRSDPSWRCAPPAPGLEDRRVEIIAPPVRKMVVNALNCGANVYVADFEDGNSPTFANILEGQLNLRDAIRRDIDFECDGKQYILTQSPGVIIMRPRGLHLDEPRVTLDNIPVSGSFFDFALYFYHNAKALMQQGNGPYFYLPKVEHYLEARLWNDIFLFSQSYIGISHGTIRATVLIETFPAAFQMEEILFELRSHSSGLNNGRWDYIFSVIKNRRADRSAVLPDRQCITMSVGFMDAYNRLLIQTCHRRRTAAMCGMSADIPIKNNAQANEAALNRLRADKLREVKAGHDGTWIAHPQLHQIAREAFDKYMVGPNQYHILHDDVRVTAADLLNLNVPGEITEEGLKSHISIFLTYTVSWIGGNGCISLNHRMEASATAEITRVQLWQWVKHASRLTSGKPITIASVDAIIDELAGGIKNFVPNARSTDILITVSYLKGQIRKQWPSEFMTSDLMSYLG